MVQLEKLFKNSTILIVGGAGFVGSNLVQMFLSKVPDVRLTVVDNLLSSEKESLPNDSRLDFIEGSITNDKILANIVDDFDYVFHLATYHGNQNSIYDPLADHENNTLATLKLLNHIKDFKNIKKVVYSSAGCSVADKTFGEARPTGEDDPITLNQDSPYSISKIIGEFYSVYFHKQHELPTVRARFQNVYGPGEILGAGQWRGTAATVWRNVIPIFIYKALKGMPLPVENNGIATRDFIYIDDICRGLIACALYGKPGDVYNISTGHEISIMELSKTINEMVGNSAGIELQPRRPWDNSGKRFGSTKKAKQEIGFEAQIGFKEGLKCTIEWAKENLPFIEVCIHKHMIYMGTD